MKCLRSGYCCIHHDVIIIDDPEIGYKRENGIHKPAGEKCKHLTGNTPGEFACSIHEKRWFKKTPCGSHGQIEQSINDPCRLGEYILKDPLLKEELGSL